jgi:hypothetical protein
VALYSALTLLIVRRELYRDSIIGQDKALKTKEVTDEIERAVKPFKLICVACDKPVGSMIVTEKGKSDIMAGLVLY